MIVSNLPNSLHWTKVNDVDIVDSLPLDVHRYTSMSFILLLRLMQLISLVMWCGKGVSLDLPSSLHWAEINDVDIIDLLPQMSISICYSRKCQFIILKFVWLLRLTQPVYCSDVLDLRSTLTHVFQIFAACFNSVLEVRCFTNIQQNTHWYVTVTCSLKVWMSCDFTDLLQAVLWQSCLSLVAYSGVLVIQKVGVP